MPARRTSAFAGLARLAFLAPLAGAAALAGCGSCAPPTGPSVDVPDALLPEQYFDRLAARTSDTPERRLLFAVLLDAVIQLQRRNTSGSVVLADNALAPVMRAHHEFR